MNARKALHSIYGERPRARAATAKDLLADMLTFSGRTEGKQTKLDVQVQLLEFSMDPSMASNGLAFPGVYGPLKFSLQWGFDMT